MGDRAWNVPEYAPPSISIAEMLCRAFRTDLGVRCMANLSRRVAVVGLGPIGTKVVKALDEGIELALPISSFAVDMPRKPWFHEFTLAHPCRP